MQILITQDGSQTIYLSVRYSTELCITVSGRSWNGFYSRNAADIVPEHIAKQVGYFIQSNAVAPLLDYLLENREEFLIRFQSYLDEAYGKFLKNYVDSSAK